MYEALIVALVALTTHRLTYLITSDRITREPREWLQVLLETRWEKRHPDRSDPDEWQSRAAYLFTCPWCVSIYVGAIVTLVTAATIGVAAPVLTWIASSSITGLLSTRGD